MNRARIFPRAAVVLAAMTTTGLGQVVIDFEGLPFTLITSGGPTVPNPASVVTDAFQDLGVVFGRDDISAGVAVVHNSFAPSSGVNSVAGLDADGIIPGVSGAAIGDIYFRFVLPDTDTPAATDEIAFTIGDVGGDLDEFNIRAFDVNDVQVFDDDVAGESRFLVTIAVPGVHRVEIDFLGVAGYSLDDLEFEEPKASECFLVIGNSPGDAAFFEISHLFETNVGPIVEDSYAVLMDSIPEFVLPGPHPTAVPTGVGLGGAGGIVVPQTDIPSWMWDGTFTVQILMWNPEVFPAQPEQSSRGLKVYVAPDGSVSTRPYGTGTGIEVWAETGVNANGQPVVRFPFLVPGM